jgi:uncharacterized oligopeptide transporter (OPT) family protein
LLTKGITAIVLAVLACITVVVKSRLPPKYHIYVPNWSAIGLAFIIPGSTVSFAMVVGATAAYLTKKYKSSFWGKYGYPIAAGLSAGEACSSLFTAGLTIADLSGSQKGSQIGCPYGEC